MKTLILFAVTISAFCHGELRAEVVGEVRFMAKIVSYDEKWVEIQSAGQHLRVPRAAVKGDKLVPGGQREVTLSQSEYIEMRNRHLIESSKRK